MGRNRINRKKINKNEDQPKFNAALCIAILAFVFVVVFGMYVQAADLFEYKQQLKSIQLEQKKQVEKNIELIKEMAYQDSDEYVEKVAREQLGLVKPNEIVYIDDNK